MFGLSVHLTVTTRGGEMLPLEQFLHDKQIVAVVCNQWGDTGKGKFVDLFSLWADMIIRGTGGANAGHTIIVNGTKLVLHLIPSGIMHDIRGKINVIGRGVAFDPQIFVIELADIRKIGITTEFLRVSHEAPLMLPYHLLQDRVSAASKGIGTTGRGIGPLYSDFAARRTLPVNDLLNPDLFRSKIQAYAEEQARYFKVLTKKERTAAEEVLAHQHLHGGVYWHPKKIIDPKAVVDVYLDEFAPIMRAYIANTEELVRQAQVAGKRLLLEGAQGHLLSILYGTTFYQTSSDPSIEGLAQGCHLKLGDVDYVLGVVKAPAMTRVGAGPFPSELGGKQSEEYCASGLTAADESSQYPNPHDLLNDDDEFKQSIGLRMVSGEYGATTGRTRRVGWLDLVAMRYSMKTNGPRVALTKFDVLTGVKKIKLCVSYTYRGKEYQLAENLLQDGKIVNDFSRFSEVLCECRPNFIEFDGWEEDISQILNYDDLPHQVRVIIDFIEQFTGCNVDIVSVGPDRNQTIIR